jgi:uncharacterized membrane protein YecN with MAPEG domain
MTVLPVTTVTSGVLGILYIGLTAGVTAARIKTRITLGDGSDKPEGAPLYTAVRAHGNFAEYVPLGLVLLGAVELAGGSHWLCEIFAGMLVVGRVLHATGLRNSKPNPFRFVGALLTWLMILGASIEALLVGL